MERLDDLIIGGLKIWQRTDQFRFSIDAIMLAHFVAIKNKQNYADLGCGTGVMPLILAAKGVKNIVGFELNKVVADLAIKSVKYNNLNEIIKIENIDYCEAYKEYGGKFQNILVNPPYFDIVSGKDSNDADISMALHESKTTLNDVACAAKRLLRFGGLLYMVYTTPRLVYALETLRKNNIEPKRLRFVHSLPKSESKLVLIEAKLGGKPQLKVEAPLYIYKEQNIYSDEVQKWYERKV